MKRGTAKNVRTPVIKFGNMVKNQLQVKQAQQNSKHTAKPPGKPPSGAPRLPAK